MLLAESVATNIVKGEEKLWVKDSVTGCKGNRTGLVWLYHTELYCKSMPGTARGFIHRRGDVRARRQQPARHQKHPLRHSEFSPCFIPQSNPKLISNTYRLSLSAGAVGL